MRLAHLQFVVWIPNWFCGVFWLVPYPDPTQIHDGVIWTCQSSLYSNYWGASLLVWILIGDKWSHVEALTSLYGKCRPHSNPANVCKSPRKAHNVTGFSVGYIWLGTRLGVMSPNPWASCRDVERSMKSQSSAYWNNVEVGTSTSIVLLKVMLWNLTNL